jgi:glycosyltransferase involved in cell wall biosynthesis
MNPVPAAKPRVCFVVSSPLTVLAFLTGHVKALGELYEVHIAANARREEIDHPDLRGVTLHPVSIPREIAPLADAAALARLAAVFQRGRYAAVHSQTPKAGLLTALAARAARVPVRIHTYTGQVWATRRGAGRALLKTLDRAIARLDTHVLVDSASQRDFLERERVLAPGQGLVLGPGSASGVDTARFRPDAAQRAAVRVQLAIPLDAMVFLFVGRLTREKGVLDLARAFAAVATARDDVYLVWVGADEGGLAAPIAAACGAQSARVRLVGASPTPERYMAAADTLCLPSYREGFGSVVIEAAAAGIPAIGSRIYGLTDAIEDGVTGLLTAPGDAQALAAAMQRIADDAPLRTRLAAAARARALKDFQAEALSAALVDFYRRTVPARAPQAAPARGPSL